jgi:DNA-binding winged helix-turn-helix (wHTH) protein/tetratricopeptide (TPR) repeat protein
MSAETKVLYEFDKFRCDPREHLLLSDGKPVLLSPKSFEILVVLLQSKGRLRTKDELMQQIWPDSFVEEANLTVNISALRKVLGENPEGQQYIETVPKRGYRFVAPVTEVRDGGAPSPPSKSAGVAPVKPLPAAMPPPVLPARIVLWWPAAAGMLLIAAMIMVLVSSRSAKLTDRDTVVLADLTNTTGDSVFDDALRQGLSSQLEQSPFLTLLSDDRIAQTVSLMGQPKESHLSPERAREVCQRTASAAVLDLAIAQVGTQYLLILKAVNCSTGEWLGSAEAQAADKNHVLDALGKVASEIRHQLGESLASVQKYDAPPEDVTTPSLEALKAYSLGYKAMFVNSDFSGAIPLFQQAIGLDPKFAMAYARMGTCYFNLGEMLRASENLRSAYKLQSRVSEWERLYIASHYETFVTGNLEAARKVYELSAQTYPRGTSFANLGLIYSDLGEYDKALPAYEEDVRLNPGIGIKYGNLVSGYLLLNRLDDAKATALNAHAHNVDSPEIHLNLYWIAFLQHDAATMEREAEGLMGKPGYEDQMLNFEADTALCGGHLAKARALTQRAIESAQYADEEEMLAFYEADAALREALVGNTDFAKRRAQNALVLSNGRDVEALSAIASGLAGDSTGRTRLADDLAKRFPEDTFVQSNYLPTIQAADWLGGGDAARATEALAAAARYDLGGNQTLNIVLYPIYLRGEAYLTANRGSAAAAEFQRILDHPGVVRNEPIGALAHLGLGRAFALSGDKIKAKLAYQEFLNLWKDSDPDIPVLQQAKAEYSKLQ